MFFSYIGLKVPRLLGDSPNHQSEAQHTQHGENRRHYFFASFKPFLKYRNEDFGTSVHVQLDRLSHSRAYGSTTTTSPLSLCPSSPTHRCHPRRASPPPSHSAHTAHALPLSPHPLPPPRALFPAAAPGRGAPRWRGHHSPRPRGPPHAGGKPRPLHSEHCRFTHGRGAANADADTEKTAGKAAAATAAATTAHSADAPTTARSFPVGPVPASANSGRRNSKRVKRWQAVRPR